MKCYVHPKYSYVSIVEIDKSEVEKVNFAACAEPRETLGSYYNRQARKPNVLINAGFFAMDDGRPVFNMLDEGVLRAENASYKTGMGIIYGIENDLKFGSLDDGSNWKDFLSAYPVLLDGNGPKTLFKEAAEINYRAMRSCVGYNDNAYFVIHIGRPGMLFNTMSQMLYDLGVKYAINLDGGGSARLMVNGEVFGVPTENRRVDNVLAFYLKGDSAQSPFTTLTNDTPYILYTVKKGDSWWGLAREHMGNGAKYKELMAFNGVTSSCLKVGDVIKVPCKEKAYIVKAGDSWWGIAAKEMGSGTQYAKLAAYNNKTPQSVLYAGQMLKIPV